MPPVLAAKKRKFDTKTFLSTIECGRKVAVVRKKQTIFAQGDSSDAVFYHCCPNSRANYWPIPRLSSGVRG
jgi:hypothetical protein